MNKAIARFAEVYYQTLWVNQLNGKILKNKDENPIR